MTTQTPMVDALPPGPWIIERKAATRGVGYGGRSSPAVLTIGHGQHGRVTLAVCTLADTPRHRVAADALATVPDLLRDRADLIAVLHDAEVLLSGYGHTERGVKESVLTRARATLAQIRASEDASRVQS